LIDSIMNKLSGTISVEVGPKAFVFTKEWRSIRVETYLYLSNGDGKHRILSVGDVFVGSSECLRAEIFGGNATRQKSIGSFDLLEAFLRFGFQKLLQGRIFIRPTVIIKGTATINIYLGGFEDYILKQAAMSAGAHKVLFDA